MIETARLLWDTNRKSFAVEEQFKNFPVPTLNQPQKLAFLDEMGKKVEIGQGFLQLLATLFSVPFVNAGNAYKDLTDRRAYALWQSNQTNVLRDNVTNSTFRNNFENLSRALADDKSISYANLKAIYRGIIPALATVRSNLSSSQQNELFDKLRDLNKSGTVNPTDASEAVKEVEAEAGGDGVRAGGGSNSGRKDINEIKKLRNIAEGELPASIKNHSLYLNKTSAYRTSIDLFLKAAAAKNKPIRYDEKTGEIFYFDKSRLVTRVLPAVLPDGTVQRGERGLDRKLRDDIKILK
jgi:hypothetical protein